MGFILSSRSEERLIGVHYDLQRVIHFAASNNGPQFAVIEGRRTLTRQQQLFDMGATRTLNSRHLTGHAVDIAPILTGIVQWGWPAFYPLAEHIKRVAEKLSVPVTWGGDWETFKDGPHWELPWDKYPRLKTEAERLNEL